MKLTSALYVRQLIAKLHPSLPKSPRESQQLVSILQSSFKRQLDDVYPPPRPESVVKLPSISPQPYKSTAAEATNTHLQAVLNHPLLEQRTTSGVYSESLPRILKQWDQALIQHDIDLQFVTHWLESYGNTTARKFDVAPALASRLVSWFSTSSNTIKEAFLTNFDIVKRATSLLYMAKMEETVWSWLQLLYEGHLRVDNPSSLYDIRSSRWLLFEDRFVACMVSQSLRRGDINGAVQEFLEACAYRVQSGRVELPSKDHLPELPYTPLGVTWQILARDIILRRRFNHGISAALYDQLISAQPPKSLRGAISTPFLHLYRPSNPTTEELLSKIQESNWVDKFSPWKNRLSDENQKALLLSIIDAAEIELDNSHSQSCRELLEFAEEHFLPWTPPKKEEALAIRLSKVREEATFENLIQGRMAIG